MNATEFALLGLLAHQAGTGYDLKRVVEERLSHFWSQSFGHIYPMLRRLEERGYVEMSIEGQDGRPDRKVYSITTEGRKALRAWFEEPPARQPPRNELLLRLFMGRHADLGHLKRDVRAHGEDAARRLAVLREVRLGLSSLDDDDPDRRFWDLTVRYGLEVLGAVEAWSRDAHDALEAMDGGQAPHGSTSSHEPY